MRKVRPSDDPIYTLGEAVEIIEKLTWDIQPDGTLLRAISLRLEPYPEEVLASLKYALKSPRLSVSFGEDRREFVVMTLINTAPPLG